MIIKDHEIRICNSCGLRYPLIAQQSFGSRCPACLGETRAAMKIDINEENGGEEDIKSTDTSEKKIYKPTFSALVDNVRSAWNVGSIFRSTDGFGFCHVYLCGITPTPDREAVKKTALGAECNIPWSYHKDSVKILSDLKKQGFRVWALEENKHATKLQFAPSLPDIEGQETILMVGNEITGVDPELLELSDEIFYIPMHGKKKSFNVAVAFGIAAFTITTQI
jgi:23S rRNA (guanosine2251-2'-O)-methyltransferase